MTSTIKIGTRGSQLALYQAEKVKEVILNHFPGYNVELVIIKSKGDKILDVALSKIGDKGLFTKELEDAMFRNEIDMAVHSLKDLPTTLPEGLKIGAVLPRGEVRDALVSTKKITLKKITPNTKIATSSLRRKAQLLKAFPELQIIDIRGNINTRLKKMEDGYCDAMIMAATGLQRLGLDKYISEIIAPEFILPAVSQGAIGIESKENDNFIDNILSKINDTLTYKITNAERVFLKKLEGGCQIPIGCYSTVKDKRLTLKGFMSYVDGTEFMQYQVSGDISDAAKHAEELADYFINNGSLQLLEKIRNANEI